MSSRITYVHVETACNLCEWRGDPIVGTEQARRHIKREHPGAWESRTEPLYRYVAVLSATSASDPKTGFPVAGTGEAVDTSGWRWASTSCINTGNHLQQTQPPTFEPDGDIWFWTDEFPGVTGMGPRWRSYADPAALKRADQR